MGTHYDAIVIGSGIGGLSAAVLLAKHSGKRVLVLERHYAAGGFTHVFRRPGFEWDVGVHYIGQVRDPESETRRIFDHLTDGRLQWASMPDVYDRIFIGNQSFDFPTGVQRFREAMKNYFPRDARAVDDYIEAVNRCVARMGPFFAEKLLPPFLTATLGGILRHPYLRYAGRTTAEVLSKFTSNRELRAVLTGQWGDYGLPPAKSSFGIHAIIAKHYFDGASYPVGGAGAILRSMTPAIEQSGGTVVVNAEVKTILLEDGRATGVRMADGAEIRAPIVISDAGAANTYTRLLPAHLQGLDAVRSSLAAIPPSYGHVCLYVGLKGTTQDLKLKGTNLWIYPSWDHDGNVERFFADPDAELPGVYISFPSAKDPTFNQRFPGHSTIEVITFVPYNWFAHWEQTQWQKRGRDYSMFKQHLTSRLLEVLYRHVPIVDGHLVRAELSTPLSTRHFMNHAHGETYGFAHTPERFRLGALGPRTPIQGLFLTGQDVAVCGVTGAIAGGVMAASAVLRRNMFKVVTKSVVGVHA
jgi:all-trans-retinol 13,14-reductase